MITISSSRTVSRRGSPPAGSGGRGQGNTFQELKEKRSGSKASPQGIPGQARGGGDPGRIHSRKRPQDTPSGGTHDDHHAGVFGAPLAGKFAPQAQFLPQLGGARQARILGTEVPVDRGIAQKVRDASAGEAHRVAGGVPQGLAEGSGGLSY